MVSLYTTNKLTNMTCHKDFSARGKLCIATHLPRMGIYNSNINSLIIINYHGYDYALRLFPYYCHLGMQDLYMLVNQEPCTKMKENLPKVGCCKKPGFITSIEWSRVHIRNFSQLTHLCGTEKSASGTGEWALHRIGISEVSAWHIAACRRISKQWSESLMSVLYSSSLLGDVASAYRCAWSSVLHPREKD